jgi:hypothetical protein
MWWILRSEITISLQSQKVCEQHVHQFGINHFNHHDCRKNCKFILKSIYMCSFCYRKKHPFHHVGLFKHFKQIQVTLMDVQLKNMHMV